MPGDGHRVCWFFTKGKLSNKNEKRAKDGYSWVHECCDHPKQIHSIHMSKCYEKSLQTWGLVSHYNIFHQPLGIIQPILIRGKTLFFVAYFLLVLDKTTCFFPILGSPKSSKKEGHGGSWKKHPAKKTPVLAEGFFYSHLLQLDLKKNMAIWKRCIRMSFSE